MLSGVQDSKSGKGREEKRTSLFYGLDTGCDIFLENGQRREHVPFGHMVGLCSGEGEGGHGHIQ